VDIRRILRKVQGDGTQKELAERLGVTEAYISYLYAGRREPGGKLLSNLLAAAPQYAEEIIIFLLKKATIGNGN